jgi:hypothetical protein
VSNLVRFGELTRVCQLTDFLRDYNSKQMEEAENFVDIGMLGCCVAASL